MKISQEESILLISDKVNNKNFKTTGNMCESFNTHVLIHNEDDSKVNENFDAQVTVYRDIDSVFSSPSSFQLKNVVISKDLEGLITKEESQEISNIIKTYALKKGKNYNYYEGEKKVGNLVSVLSTQILKDSNIPKFNDIIKYLKIKANISNKNTNKLANFLKMEWNKKAYVFITNTSYSFLNLVDVYVEEKDRVEFIDKLEKSMNIKYFYIN